MAIVEDVTLSQSSSQLSKKRRTSTAANTKKMRRIGARIFKELLPVSTHTRPGPFQRTPLAVAQPEPWRSEMETMSLDTIAQDQETLALVVGKEALAMKAFRTTVRYYFSSKQLLPVGSLVFFSEKLQHYVNPVDGILLDGRPLLDPLSDEESAELETRWQNDLSRFC